MKKDICIITGDAKTLWYLDGGCFAGYPAAFGYLRGVGFSEEEVATYLKHLRFKDESPR